MGLQVIFWQQSLKYYSLSFAYPFRSMVSFIVLFSAYFLFGESITLLNIVGLAIMSLGIFCLVEKIRSFLIDLFSFNHDHSNIHHGIKDCSLDGIYNLGVMEHFSEAEIKTILKEFRRILKKGGQIILFWPPENGSTVIFFKIVHFILNPILRTNIHFQPPEPSRVQSKKWVENIIIQSDFILEEISFSLEDFYTNMVVVARKSE